MSPDWAKTVNTYIIYAVSPRIWEAFVHTVREAIDPHGGGMYLAFSLLAVPWLLLNATIGAMTASRRWRFVRMLGYAATCFGVVIIVCYPVASDMGGMWWLRLLAVVVFSMFGSIQACREFYLASVISQSRNVQQYFVVVLSLMLALAAWNAFAIVVAWRFLVVGLIMSVVLMLPYAFLAATGAKMLIGLLRRNM